MSRNLTIELKRRTDSDGQIYYVGKIKAPVLIDCSEGAAFLIFVADKDEEQLQIGIMNESKED